MRTINNVPKLDNLTLSRLFIAINNKTLSLVKDENLPPIELEVQLKAIGELGYRYMMNTSIKTTLDRFLVENYSINRMFPLLEKINIEEKDFQNKMAWINAQKVLEKIILNFLYDNNEVLNIDKKDIETFANGICNIIHQHSKKFKLEILQIVFELYKFNEYMFRFNVFEEEEDEDECDNESIVPSDDSTYYSTDSEDFLDDYDNLEELSDCEQDSMDTVIVPIPVPKAIDSEGCSYSESSSSSESEESLYYEESPYYDCW